MTTTRRRLAAAAAGAAVAVAVLVAGHPVVATVFVLSAAGQAYAALPGRAGAGTPTASVVLGALAMGGMSAVVLWGPKPAPLFMRVIAGLMLAMVSLALVAVAVQAVGSRRAGTR